VCSILFSPTVVVLAAGGAVAAAAATAVSPSNSQFHDCIQL